MVTQFNSDCTLTRHPLCSETVACFKRFLDKIVGECLHLRSLEDEQVIPTTEFRHLASKSHCGISVTHLEINQHIAEDLTFTGTLTGVTRPLSDTDSVVAVFDKSSREVRGNVLTTRRTDLEEEIDSGGSRRLTSLHTVSGTSVLVLYGVSKSIHFHFLSTDSVLFALSKHSLGGIESKIQQVTHFTESNRYVCFQDKLPTIGVNFWL